jgi:hypothetical protein
MTDGVLKIEEDETVRMTSPIFITESVCIVWFTLEIILR